MDGFSGASVRRITTRSGDPAFLKTCAGALGETELRFYLDLAPLVGIRTPRLLDWRREDGVATLLLEDAGRPREPGDWTEGDWAALGSTLARLHRAPFGAAPLVLVHGDCHTGNVLFGEGGEPVLCDWQSTGLGRAAADLAFVRARATPSGTVVPDALLDAYLSERAVDPDRLRRDVAQEELDLLVHQFPAYAAWNTAEGNERVRRRAARLSAELSAADPRGA